MSVVLNAVKRRVLSCTGRRETHGRAPSFITIHGLQSVCIHLCCDVKVGKLSTWLAWKNKQTEQNKKIVLTIYSIFWPDIYKNQNMLILPPSTSGGFRMLTHLTGSIGDVVLKQGSGSVRLLARIECDKRFSNYLLSSSLFCCCC